MADNERICSTCGAFGRCAVEGVEDDHLLSGCDFWEVETLSEESLKDIESQLSQIIPAPWYVEGCDVKTPNWNAIKEYGLERGVLAMASPYPGSLLTANFIASSRHMVPLMLNEIRRLRMMVDFYQDKIKSMSDGGGEL